MQYNNWYILQGTFYCDIKVENSYWKFTTCKILKYDDVTKKIELVADNNEKYNFILDFKKMDPFFINKTNKFADFLKTKK